MYYYSAATGSAGAAAQTADEAAKARAGAGAARMPQTGERHVAGRFPVHCKPTSQRANTAAKLSLRVHSQIINKLGDDLGSISFPLPPHLSNPPSSLVVIFIHVLVCFPIP